MKSQVIDDLERKMVFVGGARQVGKTSLAKDILAGRQGYLNWDIAEHREKILKRELPVAELLVFDEIHKYRSWRNYLKGLYDSAPNQRQILITGSARLDYYRFGGDSLQGRYHYLRLFPLSCAELASRSKDDMLELLELGGFPEPFFSSSKVESLRWSREYRKRIIEEDIQSLERIHDLGNLELLMLRLPDLVGSPLSINAIRQDLMVSHKTVANWLKILERLYAIFRLPPFGSPKIRAVKKEQKHYHFDWTLIKEPGLRFENMVAMHLLKWVSFQEDTRGRDIELRYYRDVDGREVDFVVVEEQKPIIFVECKWSDGPISKGLKYLKIRFPECEAYQLAATGSKDYLSPDNIRVCPALDFLLTLV
ncbi:MAG: ATP-binding protein [Thermodesulfobacteriota bacterium]|nr:ATP-binding protein [Thermodesulfobacteriota bacterium]